MKRLTKPAIALASAAALVVILAAPSGASTGTVTDGTLSVNLTPALSVDMGTAGGCAATSLTVTPSSSTAGTITMSIPEGAFDYGSPSAHVLVATASGSYTVDPGTGEFTGSMSTTGGTNSARIYARTGDCTPTTSECGPIATTINFSGTFSGNTTTMVGSATLSGSGTLIAFGCSAPFSAMNGKTVTITDMDVTLA